MSLRVIYPDLIESIGASSEKNSYYEDDNAIDDHPLHVWASNTTNTGRLTCTVSAKGQAIGIYNTNATSVDIEIRNMSDVMQEDLGTISFTANDGGFDTTTGLSTSWGETFQTYTQQVVQHKVWMDFTAPAGETLYVGKVLVGPIVQFESPVYGLSMGFINNSIIEKMHIGTYIRSRTPAKTYKGSFRLEADDDFRLMHKLVYSMKNTRTAFSILDEHENIHTIFGYLSVNLAPFAYQSYDQVICNFEIIGEL